MSNSQSIIQHALQAFASNDPDRIAAVLTEDAEWLSQPGNATAVALDTTHHMVGQDACASSPRSSPACSRATST